MALVQAKNARVFFVPNLIGSRGRLQFAVGRREFTLQAKVLEEDWHRRWADQHERPWNLGRLDGRVYWAYRAAIYSENENLSQQQVHALLNERLGRRARQIERAEQLLQMDRRPAPLARGRISDEVRHFVFCRDRGLCQNCGSDVELQLDHIIPVALGGGSSPENLQVLCGTCNRRKGAGLRNRAPQGGQPEHQSVRLPRSRREDGRR